MEQATPERGILRPLRLQAALIAARALAIKDLDMMSDSEPSLERLDRLDERAKERSAITQQQFDGDR
jgi:hypothetical protein